ncbi:MAG TPA: hypothetical protein VMX97_14785, partial [Hyphomicrobiaceae bacterium]|nr:hypothetical protein [Hyphomicrobiaceae bacterium]
ACNWRFRERTPNSDIRAQLPELRILANYGYVSLACFNPPTLTYRFSSGTKLRSNTRNVIIVVDWVEPFAVSRFTGALASRNDIHPALPHRCSR